MGFDMGRVEERVGRAVVDVAVAVHRELGPGLLESVYEVVMGAELGRRGFAVQSQVPVGFEWRGLRFEEGFRADMIVDGCVLLELKSVEHLHNAHRKQLLTYLRLTNLKLGYLLNFAEPLMRQGITRTVNNL
ncbi:GxxExxY protein [Luteimonas sp. MC1782]|uniref:GxxExxY protein n=1 Tax=Luteimonas sp. MC1782 TaxID=2760305 RepID=UPI001C71C447|nr:GxxExxY protein [Luteimonas sp. MC1782]